MLKDSDTLDLDASLEAASEDLTSEDDVVEELDDTEDSEVEETTEEQPEESAEDDDAETTEDEEPEEGEDEDGEDSEVTEDQESFTHVDPNSLPDELKPVYKSLLADYTRKRQAESAEKREMQSKIDELTRQVQEAKSQANGGQELMMGLTPEEISNMSLEEYNNHVLEYANREAEAKKVEEFEQQALSDFLTIDARINPEIESAYDPRLASFVGGRVDADYEAYIAEKGTGIGFDYRGAATKYIKEFDEWVAGIRKQSVKDTAQKSKKKAQKLKRQTPPATKAKSNPSEAMSLDDSIEAAFEG